MYNIHCTIEICSVQLVFSKKYQKKDRERRRELAFVLVFFGSIRNKKKSMYIRPKYLMTIKWLCHARETQTRSFWFIKNTLKINRARRYFLDRAMGFFFKMIFFFFQNFIISERTIIFLTVLKTIGVGLTNSCRTLMKSYKINCKKIHKSR